MFYFRYSAHWHLDFFLVHIKARIMSNSFLFTYRYRHLLSDVRTSLFLAHDLPWLCISNLSIPRATFPQSHTLYGSKKRKISVSSILSVCVYVYLCARVHGMCGAHDDIAYATMWYHRSDSINRLGAQLFFFFFPLNITWLRLVV